MRARPMPRRIPLPTTKEWGEGEGEGQFNRVIAEFTNPSPQPSPLVPRGEPARSGGARKMHRLRWLARRGKRGLGLAAVPLGAEPGTEPLGDQPGCRGPGAAMASREAAATQQAVAHEGPVRPVIAGVAPMPQQLQVARQVVAGMAVAVMDVLAWEKQTPEERLHHQAVEVGWVASDHDLDVAARVRRTAMVGPAALARQLWRRAVSQIHSQEPAQIGEGERPRRRVVLRQPPWPLRGAFRKVGGRTG